MKTGGNFHPLRSSPLHLSQIQTMPPPPPPTNCTHLLIFPYPASGHILPLLDYAHHLASHGFTLTIVVTPKTISALDPLLSAHPSSVHHLLLPMPSHPKLPPGVETVAEIGNHGNHPIMLALRKLHDPIVDWFNSHPSPPVAIISDFFLGWTHHLANHLKIPRIVFHSASALAINVLDYCWRHINSSSFQSSSVVGIKDVPRSPAFRKEHLPSIIKAYRESDPDWDLLRDDAIANISSWGSVFNTSERFEPEDIEYLRKTRGEQKQFVYEVGPLSLLGCRTGTNPDRDSGSGDVILTWLNGCLDGSVLYVCFGSQKQLNRQQTEAVAGGLERSGARFVWVVRTVRGDDSDYVPDGFEDRVAGRGIVVREWAPQVRILSHRGVGGFLCHFGWNSVLESIVAGVMVLGWPMEAEQFVNARLLVENLGVAVRVCEGANSVPDSVELGKIIAESINGESPAKVKAMELREAAMEAMGPTGSSLKQMDELLNKLAHLQRST